MSNRLLNMARDAKVGNPTAKEVLKCIADQANDAGTSVWSSIGYFVFSTERSRTAVKDALRFLQDEGFIEHVGWSQYKTHRWRINVKKLSSLKRTWRNPEEEDDLDGLVADPPQSLADQGEVVSRPLTPTEPKVHTVSDEEPTLVPNDADGVPAEHIMVYHDILGIWKKKFPDKTQPQPTNRKMQMKVKARLKIPSFKERLWAAMLHAEESPSLQADSWFQLEYLLRNDDNYEKVASGEFDWKDSQNKRQPQQAKRQVDTSYTIPEQEAK
jgi:hypothetical protein